MRALCFVVVVALVGCSKKPSPVVDAGTPVVERVLLTSPTTLSLFEPADARCAWRQEDPVTKQRVELASFPGACVGVRVAWSVDVTKAVVWFDPQRVQSAGYMSQTSTPPAFADEEVDAAAKPRWFFVDLKSGKAEPLAMPNVEKTELRDVGISKSGDVVALLEEALPEGATGAFKSGDETFDLDSIDEGLPVLVHAYKREGAAWKRAETKLSTTGWDYGLGVRALDAASAFGPKSGDLLDSHIDGDEVDATTAASLKKLAPAKAQTEDDGTWTSVKVGTSTVHVWQVTGEFAHTAGLIANGDALLPELGFTDGDLVALQVSGNFLLVTKSDVGTHPRLYSLPGGKRAFGSDTARGVTFWPAPSPH